ncbi:O-antigen ligase family protein [Celeribacter marinus]|uniref:O-antigen ligase family protein n=1 Tax=Celeribacter marinus TaxID=1397108 RepID=UPI0031780E2D
MPNIIAYIMLFFWPMISWGFFRAFEIPKAVILTIVLGYLFLPVAPAIDMPLLPPLDKTFVPSLTALVFAWLRSSHQTTTDDISSRRAASISTTSAQLRADIATTTLEPWRKPRRKSRTNLMITLLCGLIFWGCWLTYSANTTPIDLPDETLPALRPYDAASMALSIAVQLLAFWVARAYLRTREAQTTLLRVFVFSALAYSCLALIELRLSPQLNNWIYGFFPHEWRQHLRNGGYRPIVFLSHGLRLGMFLTLGILSAALLARVSEKRIRTGWLAACLWLLIVLFLSKNLGAVLISMILLPVILFFSARMQIWVAVAISLLVLLYPIGRGAGYIPVERMVAAMEALSPERASSFSYRLDNEAILLEKANLKPLTGWGGYNRSRVFDEWGNDISTVDGQWILIIGTYGWIGFIGQFGLLCFPALLIWRMRKRLEVDLILTGSAVLLAGNLVDLIPNSSSVPPLWLMAGALWSQIDDRRVAFSGEAALRQETRRAEVAVRRKKIVPRRT